MSSSNANRETWLVSRLRIINQSIWSICYESGSGNMACMFFI